MNQLGQDQSCSRDAEQDPGSVHQMIIFAVVFKQITWPNEGKIVWVNGRQRSLPIELLGPPDRKPRKLWMKHEKKTLNVSGEGSISEDGEQDFDECGNGHAGVRQSLPVLFSRLLQRAVDQECAVVTHERCTTTKVSHYFISFNSREIVPKDEMAIDWLILGRAKVQASSDGGLERANSF